MSARPEDIARIDAWLGERSAEDVVQQLRDLMCDVVWAGGDLHSATDALAKHAPMGFVLDLPQYREAWESVGGQRAIDAFDTLAGDLADILKVAR